MHGLAKSEDLSRYAYFGKWGSQGGEQKARRFNGPCAPSYRVDPALDLASWVVSAKSFIVLAFAHPSPGASRSPPESRPSALDIKTPLNLRREEAGSGRHFLRGACSRLTKLAPKIYSE